MTSAGDQNTKDIHLIRHGQALHNVSENWSIPDPILTDLGNFQASNLRNTFHNISVNLIVTSPLRRTIQTAIEIFKDSNLCIYCLESCRERFGLVTCDKRSLTSSLKRDFGELVNFQWIETEEDVLWRNERETGTKYPMNHVLLFVYILK